MPQIWMRRGARLTSSGWALGGYLRVCFCKATASMTCAGVRPSQARFPFIISHSSTPNAYTSAPCSHASPSYATLGCTATQSN